MYIKKIGITKTTSQCCVVLGKQHYTLNNHIQVCFYILWPTLMCMKSFKKLVTVLFKKGSPFAYEKFAPYIYYIHTCS